MAVDLRRRAGAPPTPNPLRDDIACRRLDEDTVRTLAKMRCFRLWVGAESGSQTMLDRMQRHTDAARVPEVVGLLQSYGIEAGLFIMVGYEGEKTADLEATVQMLKDANPDLFLTALAYPIKGTPYYDLVRDRIVPLESWEAGSDRDFAVAGRHSRRFYQFTKCWMAGEVAWHRRPAGKVRQAKALLNRRLGRVGMWLTRHEVQR
jgi:anaerobic magnesium-protoporphyrin IX monomethyl ester cyclase